MAMLLARSYAYPQVNLTLELFLRMVREVLGGELDFVVVVDDDLVDLAQPTHWRSLGNSRDEWSRHRP